ncbi:hypothetical protein F5Y15DRAFT_161882 [Xylariaceae sp. FL0016]|nr:hypothetical protein F5Y15DRAFT_161882 [Xylariaceae sp. FL0016]
MSSWTRVRFGPWGAVPQTIWGVVLVTVTQIHALQKCLTARLVAFLLITNRWVQRCHQVSHNFLPAGLPMRPTGR